jgi:hypothetical protein
VSCMVCGGEEVMLFWHTTQPGAVHCL